MNISHEKDKIKYVRITFIVPSLLERSSFFLAEATMFDYLANCLAIIINIKKNKGTTVLLIFLLC